MLKSREFSLRRGSEIFAWGALAALFLIVLALELPAPLRAATIEFLFVVATYLLITFRFLFPRWNFLPRLVYATLLIDALIVGVLNLLLGEQISNFEFFFIPLILTSAVIADWRGTLFLAFFAAGVDFFVEPGMLLGNPSAMANQLLISGAFFFTALIAIGLVAHIRRRARESADAMVRAAESERQSRADAEKSARRWQMINAVGLQVQQETRAAPIFEMIGAELKALDLECLIALWDEPGKTLRVDYLSMAQTLQKYLERLAGISLRDFRIKIADLKEYQEMLATRRAQFASTSEDSLRRVHPTLSMPIIRQIFEMANAHRRIIAPLIANDQVIGVFRVWGNDLEENDVPAMTALAQHIAIALENARLYRDARRRLAQVTTLYEFSRAIAATLDPAELGARAIQALESFLAYQSGAILLVDADNRFSVLALSRQGAPPEFAARDREFVQQHDPRVGKGITGTVAQTGQALRINDTSRDPRYIQMRDDVRSELCVPLKVGERVIGVLNVESPNENAYTEEDEQLLSTVASLLAVALENARLFARAKDDAEVKAALLRELSHRVKNNLTAVAGLLYLGLDKEKATHQEIFSETLARVQSMIAAHSLLSDSPRARVDLLLLGQNILSDSIRQLTLPSQKIPYHVEGESIEISARQATSLALVLNELVTNALKHAPPNAAPQLSLTVKRDAQRVVIELFNHGDLLAENFSGSASSGIGLSLIRTLVEKDLCGRFELIARAQPRGVASVITFVPES